MPLAHRVGAVFAVAALVSGVGTVALPGSARAETPDVGETIATAGVAYGQTTITGTMATADDIDLYHICISSGAAFGVTLSGLGAGSNDGQLFLFDTSGFGKAGVDDNGSGLIPSIPAGSAVTSALPAGEYVLGISNFDRDPVSGGSEIFPSAVGVLGPVAGAGALEGWNGTGNANAMTTYTMNLTGVTCTDPVLNLPADIFVNAVGQTGGANVNYSFSAVDFLGNPIVALCVPISGAFFAIGTTTVQCGTVADSQGHSSTGSFHVVVNGPPTITVPADIEVLATGPGGAVVNFTATATDIEDGALTPVCAPSSGSTFPIGTTTVTCSANDAAGLTSTDTFSVTVLDNPPTFTAPSDITVNATTNAGAAVGFTVTGTDLEDGTLTAVCVPASGSTFPIGTTAVNCSLTDAAQQVAHATFNVTVLNTAPTVAPLANLSVTATAADGALVNFASTALDVQEGPLAPVCTPASGTKFAIGVTTVSCTATDTLALSDTKTFTVTVLNSAPIVAPFPNLSVTATGADGALVNFAPIALDTQQGPLAPVCTPASGTQFVIGVMTVSCTATDALGLSDTKTFTVTVLNTAPTVAVPANLSVPATAPSGAVVTFAATAFDAQNGALTPVCTPASGTTFAVGATTVSCTATDSLGLTATATFQVIVASQPPVVLPVTGGAPLSMVVSSLSVLLVGLALLALARRRCDV